MTPNVNYLIRALGEEAGPAAFRALVSPLGFWQCDIERLERDCETKNIEIDLRVDALPGLSEGDASRVMGEIADERVQLAEMRQRLDRELRDFARAIEVAISTAHARRVNRAVHQFAKEEKNTDEPQSN